MLRAFGHKWSAELHGLTAGFTLANAAVAFSIITMMGHILYMRCPEYLSLNMLATPSLATPLFWTFCFATCIVSPLALALVINSARIDSTNPRYSSRQRVLIILSAVLSLLALFVGMLTPGFDCVKGLPWYSKGGFCVCEIRSSRAVEGTPLYSHETEPETLIAFFGDSTPTVNEKLYNLINTEAAASKGPLAVVINGDLDYRQAHSAWKDQLDKHVPNASVFITAGNHDTLAWTGFQDAILEHWTTNKKMPNCRGEIGVRNVCTHSGVGILLSGVGTSCGGPASAHVDFFDETLTEFKKHKVTWRICAFHHQQRLLQSNSKSDVTGWAPFELCHQHGAIIINSHDHVYARTHELHRISREEPHVHAGRKIPPRSSAQHAMTLGPGRSVVVTSGLGGFEVKTANPKMVSNDWWACSFNRDTPKGREGQTPIAPNFGVFFCRFHIEGDPFLAHCFFKTVDHETVDDFYIRMDRTTESFTF